MPAVREQELVWNVVFTPGTFRHLRPFTTSLLAESRSSVRLVANGCPDDEVALMRAYARGRPGRARVHRLAEPAMVTHGDALEELYAATDDGACFCFCDSDVIARGPFAAEFAARAERVACVTSGSISWGGDTVLPAGSRALAGRFAVGGDGFVYGTSFFALYRRAAVDAVRGRFGVTFRGYAHATLPDAARRRIEEMGRAFDLYDTAKALNILLQGEGLGVEHVEHPALLHLGGISAFLSDAAGGNAAPPPHGAPARRLDAARRTAAVLAALTAGDHARARTLADADPELRPVLGELVGLVTRHAAA